MFKMKPKKTITSIVDKFNEIVTKLKQLRKEITKEELIKKLLNTLPKEWKPKVTVIKEAKDLTRITMDEIVGSLLTYEQELKEDEEEENKKLANKRKNLALNINYLKGRLPTNPLMSKKKKSLPYWPRNLRG
ncbi:hypothetical protein PTKIN_Ptkin12aG0111000 [Pterospermum kingtungense]